MAQVDHVLFLMDFASDRAVVTASSEVAAMPATNLQDSQRSVLWRSGAGSPQTIDITLDAAEGSVIGAAALVDHNLTADGTIQLQGWGDAIDGSDLRVDETVTPWADFTGLGVDGFGQGGYGGAPTATQQLGIRPVSFIPLDNYYSIRYWRLTITDANLTDYVEAGRLYLGSVWQPVTNVKYGWRQRVEGRSKYIESRGGQDYGNPKLGRQFLTGQLSWLDPVDRDGLFLRYLVVGDHTPFIVCMRPSENLQRSTTAIYGKFKDMEITEANYKIAEIPIIVREAL